MYGVMTRDKCVNVKRIFPIGIILFTSQLPGMVLIVAALLYTKWMVRPLSVIVDGLQEETRTRMSTH